MRPFALFAVLLLAGCNGGTVDRQDADEELRHARLDLV